MHLRKLPQDRIAKRLGVPQQTISRYLPKMPRLAKWVNRDLSKGFTVPQVAQKHDWPGRIPAQLVAHILYFFLKQNDLIFDPMAGGGVCADTCLAMGRRCWSLDMEDRPDTRPEIEPYHWNLNNKWDDLPIMGSKGKPDLIICDPPYFDKKAGEYAEKSI